MRPAGLLSMSTSKKTLGLARAKFEVENFEVVCLMSLNMVLFFFNLTVLLRGENLKGKNETNDFWSSSKNL